MLISLFMIVYLEMSKKEEKVFSRGILELRSYNENKELQHARLQMPTWYLLFKFGHKIEII